MSQPLIELDPLPWMEGAACTQVDPELFFPRKGPNRTTKAARSVCRACPVSLQCLEWALGFPGQEGILGGMTERERRRLRKEREARQQTAQRDVPDDNEGARVLDLTLNPPALVKPRELAAARTQPAEEAASE
jgi:WhiB family redox-sensing transcriptional regulator